MTYKQISSSPDQQVGQTIHPSPRSFRLSASVGGFGATSLATKPGREGSDSRWDYNVVVHPEGDVDDTD